MKTAEASLARCSKKWKATAEFLKDLMKDDGSMLVRRLYLLEVSMWQKTLPTLETILVRFHAPIIITSNVDPVPE